MERLLQPHEKESMRIAMIKQEEMFKEQVCELHRLYRIQKILMNTMKNRGSKNEISTSWVNCSKYAQQESRRELDMEQTAKEYISDEGENGEVEIEDEIDIELTLGLASYRQRKKGETSVTSDSGPSISSSSSNESSHTKITQKSMDIREELTGYEWRDLIQIPDNNPSFQNGKKNSCDVGENLSKERVKRPTWSFHMLSLNMT